MTCQYFDAHLSTQLFSPTFKSPSLYLWAATFVEKWLWLRLQPSILSCQVGIHLSESSKLEGKHLLSMHFSKQVDTILRQARSISFCSPLQYKLGYVQHFFDSSCNHLFMIFNERCLSKSSKVPIEQVDPVVHLLFSHLYSLCQFLWARRHDSKISMQALLCEVQVIA